MAYSVADALRQVDKEEQEELWYEMEGEGADFEIALAQAIFDEVNRIEDRQPHVLTNYREFFRMYNGYDPVAMTWGPDKTLQRPFFAETRGLVRAACDTATALISQHLPKATVLTEGADFRMQLLATDLDLFLIGAYYAGGVYQVAPQCFRDATVCGTGSWTYVPEGKGRDFRIRLERVFPGEVVIPEDQCESKWDAYTERYRVMRWSKARVRKTFKDAKFLGGDDWSLTNRESPGAGKCWVIQAWHICEDIRRMVTVYPGGVLEDKEWEFKFFPFDDIHWVLPSSGFYGDGISYRQYAKQKRLNFLHQLIHKGQNLMITPRIFNMPGAPPQSQNIADLGIVVSGRADPKFITQQAFGPEMYNWVETLNRAGFEDEGISVASAANYLPPGLESAPAQQEYSFKEAQRFAPVSQRYETTVAIKVAEKMIAFYAAAAAADEAPQARITSADFVSLVDWPEVDPERDVFHIQIGASSIETLSPAGKIQSAMNLVQLQLVSPQDARILIRHPDLKHVDDLATSSRRYADAFLAECLAGRPPPIDKVTDLVGLQEILTAGYNKVASIGLRNPTKDVLIAIRTIRDTLVKLEAVKQEMQTPPQPAGINDPGTDPAAVPDSVGDPKPSGPIGSDSPLIGPAIDPSILAAALGDPAAAAGPGAAGGVGGLPA